MTLVLEESEDISSEILNLLLANVKKDNQVNLGLRWLLLYFANLLFILMLSDHCHLLCFLATFLLLRKSSLLL